MRHDRITISLNQMGGLPCIRGLRIPVSTVLGQLAAGRAHEEILADFAHLDELTSTRPSGTPPPPPRSNLQGRSFRLR